MKIWEKGVLRTRVRKNKDLEVGICSGVSGPARMPLWVELVQSGWIRKHLEDGADCLLTDWVWHV